jgi:twitching motility two-component system response regulator PilG
VNPKNDLAGLKILVIDDSKTIRRTAETLLAKEGCEVFTAVDGFDALSKIADHRPDIIFVDIMMPRLDGYQTCSLIKHNKVFKDTPVIMLSSKDGLFDRARGRLVGSEQYLTKPFTKDELLGAIHSHEPKKAGAERTLPMALIMIVDDSPTEVHVLKTALEKHGFDTVSAADGSECLSLAREVRPDLIFMDVVMPRVNGYQATRTLTRDPQTKSIPVVMITTKDQETDRIWGMRQGAVDYLVKPVTEAVLIAKAQEVLERGSNV